MATTMSSIEQPHIIGNEKLKASHIDDAGSDPSLSDDEEYTIHEQRKIIHRVDRRLVSTCGFMYCISLMDRTNLGQAVIAGMSKELKLTVGFRYVSLRELAVKSSTDSFQSIIVLVFFITYVIFQPPATVLCRKIGPRPFLSFITFAWGVVMVRLQIRGCYKTLTRHCADRNGLPT
jgi:hypothetical protein